MFAAIDFKTIHLVKVPRCFVKVRDVLFFCRWERPLVAVFWKPHHRRGKHFFAVHRGALWSRRPDFLSNEFSSTEQVLNMVS